MKNKKIKIGPRSRVRLLPEEMDLLTRYVNEIDPSSGFKNITDNTGVKRETVLKAIDNNYMELRVADKLRSFLKALKEVEYYEL